MSENRNTIRMWIRARDADRQSVKPAACHHAGDDTVVVRTAPIAADEPWVEGNNYVRVSAEEFYASWRRDYESGCYVKMETPAPPARDWAKEQTGCELLDITIDTAEEAEHSGLLAGETCAFVRTPDGDISRLRVEVREAFAWDDAAARWVKVRIERA